MLKKMLLASAFISITAFTYSQTIPKGVKYKPASEENNRKARLLLKEAIEKNLADSIFGNICYIGPVLWLRYKEMDSLSVMKGGNIQFNVPAYDKVSKKKITRQMSGKLIQNHSDFKKVWNQVCLDLKDSISFKKLSATQLTYYWAVIFFDIEEPVFIADDGVRKLLIQLSPRTNKILWIDEVFD